MLRRLMAKAVVLGVPDLSEPKVAANGVEGVRVDIASEADE